MTHLMMMVGLAAMALAMFCYFNPSVVPCIIDTALHIEDAVTKTASYAGAVLDLRQGFAPQGIGQPVSAVVNVTALDIASGDETYTFTLQECDTSGGTFVNCGIPLVLTAAAVSVIGSYPVYGLVSKRFVKVNLVAGGTTPSITYSTDFGVVGVGA